MYILKIFIRMNIIIYYIYDNKKYYIEDKEISYMHGSHGSNINYSINNLYTSSTL
jgi:hypothetical protein